VSESLESVETVPQDTVQKILESLLLVSDLPLKPLETAATLGLPLDSVNAGFAAIRDQLNARNAGMELRDVAGGWRLYTAADMAGWVERFIRDGQVARLTQASLETLAVIAYKQPISRARISAIRGVNVDGVVKTLENRGLIEIAETDAESGSLLYRTSVLFLEKLGLSSLQNLPPLAEHVPDLEAAVALQESL